MSPSYSEARREEAVARSGLMTMGHDPELAAIVAFAAARYKAMFAGLSIITGRRQVLLATIGTDLVETLRDESFCATTIQRPGEPLIVADARKDKRFSHLAVVTGEPFVRFYAGAPIVDQNGYALGALCVGDRLPRHDGIDPTDLMMRGREVERLLHW